MIECPDCKISFSPSHRVCPRCKAYQPTLQDRIEYLADKAEAALDRGAARARVESWLVQEGLPPQWASELVSARARKVRRSARSYGSVRLLVGLGVLLAASVVGLLGLAAFPTRVGKLSLGLAVLMALTGARPFL